MKRQSFRKSGILNTDLLGSKEVGKLLLMGLVLGSLLGPYIVLGLHVLILHSKLAPFALIGLAGIVSLATSKGLAKRLAVYVRVSTEEQAREGYSLDAQISACKAYASLDGDTVVDVYVDDGYSARKERRPAYIRMMKEQHRWDAVLVLKIDRIHRNSRNFMDMVDTLRGNGKEFISVQEKLDTRSAMGRFVMDIIQRIAQLESDQIGERTKLANDEKRKQYRHWGPGPRTPWGYSYYQYTAGRRTLKNLKPNEWAPWVLRVFEAFAEGSSTTEIALWLNKKGIRTPEGTAWREKRIALLLAHEAYLGIRMSPNMVDTSNHDPIVPLDLFLKAQRRMAEKPKPRQYIRNEQMTEEWLAARKAALDALSNGKEYHAEF